MTPASCKGFTPRAPEADKAFGKADVLLGKTRSKTRATSSFRLWPTNHGKRRSTSGERDCSIQRRNQKIVEEAPSPFLDESLRKAMGKASVKLAEAVGYQNAGTMEFLVDEKGQILLHGDEHPHPGGALRDRGGLRLRPGERSRFASRSANISPSTFERDDPTARHRVPHQRRRPGGKNFQPSPGKIDLYYAPGGRGVRVDSHAYAGYTIPPHYDSMIGKLITSGSTRASAVARMSRALGEYMITGIKTTIPFQQEIMRNADFQRGQYHTGFVAALRG